MPIRPLRLPLTILLAMTMALAACGGGSDAASGDSTTTTTADAATTTRADDVGDEEPTEPEQPVEPVDGSSGVPGAEADPTAVLQGDKAILLDGFLGVRIPQGWAVSTATAPEPSVSPAGGETEVDTDAIDQALVIGPEVDPRAATFSVLHYSHSDSVPGLAQFTDGIRDVIGADGTHFTEGQEAQIGGQDAVLHQLQTTDGDNGVLVTMRAGDEYFFILSIVTDDSFAGDAGDLLTSVSVEPGAIR